MTDDEDRAMQVMGNMAQFMPPEIGRRLPTVLRLLRAAVNGDIEDAQLEAMAVALEAKAQAEARARGW